MPKTDRGISAPGATAEVTSDTFFILLHWYSTFSSKLRINFSKLLCNFNCTRMLNWRRSSLVLQNQFNCKHKSKYAIIVCSKAFNCSINLTVRLSKLNSEKYLVVQDIFRVIDPVCGKIPRHFKILSLSSLVWVSRCKIKQR